MVRKFIESNELFRAISREIKERIRNDEWQEKQPEGMWRAWDIAYGLRAADAVEVVRCRDCRFYSSEDSESVCAGRSSVCVSVNDEDYCSFGERKL